MPAFVLCHGGAGGRKEDSDGCRLAAQKGLEFLGRKASALDAAVEAVVILEDDPRYNAGTGAVLRCDGKTVERDAAVMDSDGRIGAVAALRSVKNPVRAARRVADTPHALLAGEGALAFAERCGLRMEAPFVPGTPSHPESCDTVGAVARDAAGRFAVAASTGGVPRALVGRVGDTPLPGCGYWAGPAGAAAATGIGEQILRRVLCKTVYDWIAGGLAPGEACRRGVALFPDSIEVGLIAVSASEHGWADNRGMPVGAAGD